MLEVSEPVYTRRFGGPGVTATDVLDIDPENAEATIVADVAAAGSLPASQFDCVVVTQTLQYVDDPGAAIVNLWQGLAPRGSLLLTVPCLQRIDPDLPTVDRWRFTPLGLRDLVGRACTGGEVNVEGHGNVLASVAFLMGLGADELRRSELEDDDPDFPLVACARVRKPS